ncbi:unnamed protein product, partial [Effrenium voratum]
TLFWMASREGLGPDGSVLTESVTFSSVQRLSRRMGKSDVRVQLKVERLFHAKGGLLADAVGYGKTASVLALVALSPSPPPTLRPQLLNRRILSRATLILLPANL